MIRRVALPDRLHHRIWGIPRCSVGQKSRKVPRHKAPPTHCLSLTRHRRTGDGEAPSFEAANFSDRCARQRLKSALSGILHWRRREGGREQGGRGGLAERRGATTRRRRATKLRRVEAANVCEVDLGVEILKGNDVVSFLSLFLRIATAKATAIFWAVKPRALRQPSI